MIRSSQIRGSRRPATVVNGFTLIEMVIALLILFIAVMGVFAGITWATRYNHGNSQRSQALAVMQREIEFLRSAKFTPATLSTTHNAQPTAPVCPDAIDLDNGRRSLLAGSPRTDYRCGIDGTVYQVTVTIDDDPSTPTTVESYPWPRPTPAPSPAPSPPIMYMKQITIVVTPVGAERSVANGQSWVTANPIRMTFRRTLAN